MEGQVASDPPDSASPVISDAFRPTPSLPRSLAPSLPRSLTPAIRPPYRGEEGCQEGEEGVELVSLEEVFEGQEV